MPEILGATLNHSCPSSLPTIRMAFHTIKAGKADVFVAASVEIVAY